LSAPLQVMEVTGREEGFTPAASRGSPIFLVGFMGAGKSTVGPILAKALGYDFFDLDDKIEARAGRTVRDIFSEFGEFEFRRLEREALEACAGIQRAVIALGGGAYISEDNRALVQKIGKTVWIDCPLETCFRRVAKDSSRPLLGSKEEMERLLTLRRPSYEFANLIVRAGSAIPRQVAQEILRLLDSEGGQE
jgi:shikimate kinase